MMDARGEVSAPPSILPQWEDVSAVALPVIWLQIARGPGRTPLPAKASQSLYPSLRPNQRPSSNLQRARQVQRKDLNRSSPARLKRKPRREPLKLLPDTLRSTGPLHRTHLTQTLLPQQDFITDAPSIPAFHSTKLLDEDSVLAPILHCLLPLKSEVEETSPQSC